MKVREQVVFWLAASILALLAILMLQDILLPFVVGIVIAYALNPIVAAVARLGVPRILASLGVLSIVLFVIGLALIFLLPLLIAQAEQLVVALPGAIDKLRAIIETAARERLGSRFDGLQESLLKGFGDLSNRWTGLAGVFAQSLWSQGVALLNFLALLLVTPVVAFYLLADWPAIVAKLDAWLPREHAPTIRRVIGQIDQAIAAFIRGQGLVCLILAVIYAAGLQWAGLKYGLLIGALSGLLSFVPFVGWALGLMTAVTFAVLEYWPNTLVLYKVIGVFAAGQALDAGFLAPRVVGPKIGLHPVWLIFALFVFSYLFGFVGTLVAVPLAAATAVLVRFALEVYLDSAIYRGAGAGSATASEERDGTGPGNA